MRPSCILALSVAACATGSPPAPRPLPAPPDPPPAAAAADWAPDDAASGIADPRLTALLRRHWAWTMREYPVWATQLGIRRFDDRLTDPSAAAVARRRAGARQFLQEARALSTQGLSERDRLFDALFVDYLEADAALDVCEYELWSLSPRSNVLTRANRLPELHLVESELDAKHLLARYRALAPSIEEQRKLLLAGLKRGLVANAETTRRLIGMLKQQLAQPPEDWPLSLPIKKEHAGFSDAFLRDYRSEMQTLVAQRVRPALSAYLATLERDVLPSARGPEAEGLGGLPVGKPCYEAEIRSNTTQRRSAEDIHALGLRELAGIEAQMLSLGKKLFRSASLPQLFTTLRTDKKLYFDTSAEIEQHATATLARARAAIPEYFGVLPRAECVVKAIPEYEAPTQTIAYYWPPFPDGTKPGEYFVNLYQPQTRPRFSAEVLAFHESIPGHHLQVSLAQQLEESPAFAKHDGKTVFIEGWGLYAERLAAEMNLYSGDLDRLGMLVFDAWRASRLVVDTGLHAMGWTRERAERFMLEHTALAENNIANEVDRYITTPGQALAYKIGQLEILRLRQQAERELGAQFELRAFHDALLSEGALPLGLLDRRMQAWLDQRR